MTATLLENWTRRAACRDMLEFTADAKGGPTTSRGKLTHICLRHCPVLAECTAEAEDSPPMGTVMAGKVWAEWSKQPTPVQPDDPGCGPWCQKFRVLPTSGVRKPRKPPEPVGPLTPLQQLGKFIRALREARGWTQVDLAVKSNSSRSVLSRLERGEYDPPITLLFKLATALEVAAAQLAYIVEK